MVSYPSFSQPSLWMQPPLQSPPKTPSSTLVNFHLPIPPLLFSKITLTTATNTSFIYAAAIFHLPIFAYNDPSNLHQKYFPNLSNLANSHCVKGQKSYGVSISPLFLKVWTVITGLTLTPSCSGSKNWCIARSSLE